MRIDSVHWLPRIVEKLDSKHGGVPDEVEDLLHDEAQFRFVERGHIIGDDVYAALGRTRAGRYLIVYFVLKSDKTAIVVSARDMSSQERRAYERK